MSTKSLFHGLRALGLALLAGFLVTAPTHAYAQGHFGGGGHVGSVGFHGGGFHGGVSYHGGYRGGWGGYGYGWRGGFGCCGWGWGWGWPGYGLFLATLPFYYSTVWWEGAPYYYADDTYYVYNAAAGGYVSVPPPGAAPAAQTMNQAPAQPGDTDLFAYPKNAQSAEQQARDRQECRSWAASQSGAGAAPANRGDNLRAQAACLEGRGYSVR
jgi:hypothetical protein